MENNYFTDIYDFHGLVKVKEHESRTVRYIKKQDNRKRRKLKEPLNIWEKVFIIAESLKNVDPPGVLYKISTENKKFFNRNKIFKINKKVGIDVDKINYHWVEKDRKIIRDRFYRQKLFALMGQFEQKNRCFICLFW